MSNLSASNSIGAATTPKGFFIRALRNDSRFLLLFHRIAALPFVVVLLLSSMYCVLAYIPTTYFAFIQAPFQSWMPLFSRLQPYLFAVTFCAVGIPGVARFRCGANRRLALEFVLVGIMASVYLIWARPVRLVHNDSLSFLWSIAFLIPIIWLGALDYLVHLPEVSGQAAIPRSTSYSYTRVALAGLVVSLLYPGAAYLRFFIAGQRPAPSGGDWIVWMWASLVHISLFLFVFSGIEMASRLAERATNPSRARLVLFTGVCWLGVAVAFDKVILASIPFAGIEATIYACLFSLAGITFVGGWLLSRRAQRGRPAVSMAGPAKTQSRKLEFVVLPLLLFASALTVPSFIGVLDWNSVLEKTWAMAYWCIAAGIFIYRWDNMDGWHRPRWHSWLLIVTAVSSLLAFRLGVRSQKIWGDLLSQSDFDVTTAIERRMAIDPSFAAASEIMTASSTRSCNAQCNFIIHQTNIPPSAIVALPDVDIVEKLQPVAGPKPNVFVFVVDSLRQDYVSPYNPAVSFTPAIQAFAGESVVFRNAFTRYGGTTLSEPSIWSGMLMLHKHYVQPFHYVNSLEKLTQADGYQSFVSIDTVLRVLLERRPDTVELDSAAAQWTDLDLCSTTAEVANKLSARHDDSRPVFFYTQSQNVHVITLSKTSAIRPPKKRFDPFVSYYASELERLDGCFGNFIQTLKNRGLYENSIIVFTSDHGEDLEQVGAERHAFSLKPAVIRIPLIIHVPRQIERTWYYDPDAIAFNTDIAPTLYELLGHGPVIARPEFGRPLFTPTSAEASAYPHDSYLIASSYGPLYGLLEDNGTKLFTEDESRGREQFFDLDMDPGATHSVLTEEMRLKSEAQLRTDLQHIADLYGYIYRPPSLLDWLLR